MRAGAEELHGVAQAPAHHQGGDVRESHQPQRGVPRGQLEPVPRRERHTQASGRVLLGPQQRAEPSPIAGERLDVLAARTGQFDGQDVRLDLARADPWPARSDGHAAASPTSTTRPHDQNGIRIWLGRSK
jgi:hypothetical protein